MKNIDNESTDREYKIYLVRTRQLIAVSEEVYKAYYRPIWRIRDHARRNGQCGCTNWKLCDGDCGTCKYRQAGNTRSLDQELGSAEGSGYTLRDTIPDPSPDIESVLHDSYLLDELLQALDELDPDGRRICDLIAEGKSEREIAADFGITQSTLNYRKRKILKQLRERLEKFR